MACVYLKTSTLPLNKRLKPTNNWHTLARLLTLIAQQKQKPVKPLPTIHELEDVYDYDFDTESGGTGLLGPNQEVIMSTELAIREAKQADQEGKLAVQEARLAIRQARKVMQRNKRIDQIDRAVEKVQEATRLVNKTDQQAKQAVKQPSKAAQQFKQGVKQPQQAVEKTAQQPDQAVEQSKKTAQQPEQAVEKTAQQPEQAVEKTAQQPEQAVEKTAQQPEQAVEKTAQQAQKPVESKKTEEEKSSAPKALPQDTIYWTSASRRRQEYAAIDAASHGISGWMKRKVLPKNMGGLRHIPFDGQDDDDDARSVRRHRVDLEGVPEKIRFDMAGKEGAQTEIELLPQTETQVLSPRKKLLRGLSFKSNK